jgi:hypothetical protein
VRRGTKHSAETCEKLRLALIGKSLSPEHRAKVSVALLGKPRSDDVRAKISAGHKAKGETEHLRRLHSMGGRIGGQIVGRLNRGKRRVVNPMRNEERYLDPDEAADLVASRRWIWGRRPWR